MKLGRILSVAVVLLLAAQTAKAEFFTVDPVNPGKILQALGAGIVDVTTPSTYAANAGSSSNPATNIFNVGKSNWVFQFDLNALPAAEDIVWVDFSVVVEGNDDPGLYFGVGHGVGLATDPIGVGSNMSPGPMQSYYVDQLTDTFFLDVTDDIKTAKTNGDLFYRFALSANPDIQAGFTSASFYLPQLEVEAVPEPSTIALFGMGALLVGLIRFRKRK